jgi:hypothetical protein
VEDLMPSLKLLLCQQSPGEWVRDLKFSQLAVKYLQDHSFYHLVVHHAAKHLLGLYDSFGEALLNQDLLYT